MITVHLLVGKNRQDCSYSANSLLFRPQKKRRRKPQFPTAIIPSDTTSNQFADRQTGCGRTTKLNLHNKVFSSPCTLPLACLRRAVKMALERHNFQTALTRLPWANVPKILRHCKQERTVQCSIIFTEQFPASAPLFL